MAVLRLEMATLAIGGITARYVLFCVVPTAHDAVKQPFQDWWLLVWLAALAIYIQLCRIPPVLFVFEKVVPYPFYFKNDIDDNKSIHNTCRYA
jgi:hypothetical protein